MYKLFDIIHVFIFRPSLKARMIFERVKKIILNTIFYLFEKMYM